MSLGADTEQETTAVSKRPLEGEGWVLVHYQYSSSGNDEVLDETSESVLALGKVRTDTSHVHLEGS